MDRAAHLTADHAWAARCGEEAFLLYLDVQCCGERTLRLPEDKTYRVELIDTWEMTRTVLRENARGETKLRLPGREDMALLAVRNG